MKAQSPGSSFLSSVLIGRAGHVEYLKGLFDPQEPGPRAVLVSGEAGIGKSRLVREICSFAEAGGYRVLQGTCFERDGRLPYSALLDLIRMHLLGLPAPELETLLGNLGSEIVKLVPELALVCPVFVPTPPLDAAQERGRLFQALSLLFEQMSARQPVVIVLEDVHWADETTLEFVLQFCRRISGSPTLHRILLLMSYRNEDAGPTLVHTLAELDRMRLATELLLDPLTRAETDVMVRGILDLHRSVPREYLDYLYQLTEGNPFFVEEVLKAVFTGAGVRPSEGVFDRSLVDLRSVPRTVQDAVGQRCRALSAPTRELLDLAAVTGQRFDLRLLQRVTGRESDVLLGQVKELIAAQLVAEEASDRFRFRHALTREAVYFQLLASERRARHRVLAEALENLSGGSQEETAAQLSELAYHFYEAEAWDRAVVYCELAARNAEELFSPGAAVQHLGHALDAAARLGHGGSPSVLRRRAKAFELIGELEKATADLEAALQSARSLGDSVEEWEVLTGLGLLWSARNYGQAERHLHDALELARSIGDRRLVAHSLNRVGNWLMNVGDPPRALVHHEEALSTFRSLGDRPGTAETLDLLGMTSFHLVKSSDQVAYYRQAITLFREQDARQGLASSLSVLAMSSCNYEWAVPIAERDDFDAAVTAGEEAVQISRDIGWRAGEAFACYALGMTLGAGGDYGRALSLARESLSVAEEIAHTQWVVAALRLTGELELDLLFPERARAKFASGLKLAQEIKSSFWTACLSAGLSRAACKTGELDLASTLLDPFDVDSSIVMATWLAGCARVELALARGDFPRATELAASLERRAWPTGRPSRLTLLQAEALLGMGRFEDAGDVLDRIPIDGRAFVPSPLLWRAQVIRGRLLNARGPRGAARQEYESARVTIGEIGECIDDGELRREFVERACSQLPPSRPPSARAVAKERFQGLTEREREVASLVAVGCSNREIADALVLSERTVAVHVANTLAKLGFNSRTQIASWATARGLTPPAS